MTKCEHDIAVTKCSSCSKVRRNELQRIYREKKNLLGICLRCKKPSLPELHYCKEHHDWLLAYNKERHKHPCPRCGGSITKKKSGKINALCRGCKNSIRFPVTYVYGTEIGHD